VRSEAKAAGKTKGSFHSFHLMPQKAHPTNLLTQYSFVFISALYLFASL